MANNRTEAKAAVTAAIVPAVSNAQHIALLNDEINESTVFRKDVIASETEAGGNVTIDYANKDTATVTTAVNLAVSFTGMENGDVKYLEITKGAANTLSFAGATDISQRKTYINTLVTVVQYEIKNKNGVITVESINIDNDISGNLLTKIVSIGDWDMDANLTVSIAHGVDASKIRKISVVIVSDVNGFGGITAYFDFIAPAALGPTLTGAGTTGFFIDSTNINLVRENSSFFDNSTFNATSYNRGDITIDYLP